MSKYAIVYERAGDGTWSAMIPDLPGVWSTGKTITEARANVLDAAVGWLEIMREQGREIPARVHKAEEVSIAIPRKRTAIASVRGGRRRAR